MKRAFVKPLDGRKPVYPRSSRLLPVEGAVVNVDDVYWQRRLLRDVEITDPPKASAGRAKRATPARERGNRAD
jgi:hypothetical protein